MKWLYVFAWLLWIADLWLLFWGLNHYSFFNDEITFWESIKGILWTLAGCAVLTCAAIGTSMAIASIIAVETAKKAAKAADKAIDKAIEYVFDVISGIIDWFTIKETVNKKVPDALKIMILEKKEKAIDVGIWSNESDMAAKMTLSSEDGVAEEIYKGQIVYLQE